MAGGVCGGMRSRTKNLVCGLALLVACGPEVSQKPALELPAPDGVVWVRTDEAVVAVEVPEGTVRTTIPNAVANRDFTEIYSARSRNGKTALVRWGAEGARRLSRMNIAGRFAANVVGPRGLVALTEPRSDGATPWLPDGRTRTTVVVAHPGTGTERRFRLNGNFEPEAFSTNGKRLYTIEYVPPSDPNRYRVRILNLVSGKVSAIGRLRDKVAPDEMRGTGRMQVFAPERDELYTLYTRQGPNYVHGAPAGAPRGRTHAFIHLLNLKGGWAHCIDLPLPFGTGDATAGSIDISPDGRVLYVVDWTNGAVAVVNPAAVKVMRVAHLPLGDPDDRTFAAAAGSGLLHVAGNDSVVTIDPSSLKVVDRWRMDGEIVGLEASPDGRTLYVAVDDSIMMVDAATGSPLGTLPVGPVDDILRAES